MIEIRTERIGTVVEELQDLVQHHWAEVNVFDVPLDIDWSQYLKLDQTGHYHLSTIRDDDHLTGWAGYFVYPHIRHKTLRIAREDWYYVRPASRGAGLGRRLFEHAEECLRERGVDRIMISCKTTADHTGLLESLGYQHHEKNFTKALTLNEI